MAEKEYAVNVTRTSHSTRVFKVKAANKKEAEEKALDNAGSFVFSEDDAEYDVQQSTLINKDNEGYIKYLIDHDLTEK